MKFKLLTVTASLLALSSVALADDFASSMPANNVAPTYAGQTIYPASLMTQGFFVSIDGTYSKRILAANTVLANNTNIAVKYDEPWGFAGAVGYETHFGRNGSLIGGLEAGYRYLGHLSFNVTSGSGAAPKSFRLQAGTGMVDLGLQMGRLDMIAKGGVAVEIGGHAQATSDVSTTYYRFGTRVVPMAGGEIGFAVMPNLKLSVEGDYIFGHRLNSSNIGNGQSTGASGGYQAATIMAGLTYYMN